MSGLLALLDDVAAIAKVAATSLDDVAMGAAKAGAKAAGAVIDDAAVSPKYVHGFAASRELPIVGKIALGSVRNKLIVLLPLGLALSAFAPGAITPLLMLGGAYLSFEGAEKVWHAVFPREHVVDAAAHPAGDPARLEEEKVAGAIKTDFILSAEIMTIALAALPASALWIEAAALAVVALGITLAVYGSVAVLVKMDDIGLAMAERGHFRPTRAVGRMLVRTMPHFMTWLSNIGTAAMLWVGGNILMHGLAGLGWSWPEERYDHAAQALTGWLDGRWGAAAHWLVVATFDGLTALAFGVLLLPVATHLIGPLWKRLVGR